MTSDFTNHTKTNHGFEFLNLDYLWSNFIAYGPFLDLAHPSPKKFTSKFEESNHGFKFSILDFIRTNFIQTRTFSNIFIFWAEIPSSRFSKSKDGFRFSIFDNLRTNYVQILVHHINLLSPGGTYTFHLLKVSNYQNFNLI